MDQQDKDLNHQKKTKIGGSIKDHIDHMNVETKLEIDLQLAKFFYSTGLSASNIDSPYLKKALEMLRSSYTPPTSAQMDKDLEENVYQQLLSSFRSSTLRNGTLVLHSGKYGEVRTFVVRNFS